MHHWVMDDLSRGTPPIPHLRPEEREMSWWCFAHKTHEETEIDARWNNVYAVPVPADAPSLLYVIMNAPGFSVARKVGDRNCDLGCKGAKITHWMPLLGPGEDPRWIDATQLAPPHRQLCLMFHGKVRVGYGGDGPATHWMHPTAPPREEVLVHRTAMLNRP
jgi:hypothetical protein